MYGNVTMCLRYHITIPLCYCQGGGKYFFEGKAGAAAAGDFPVEFSPGLWYAGGKEALAVDRDVEIYFENTQKPWGKLFYR